MHTAKARKSTQAPFLQSRLVINKHYQGMKKWIKKGINNMKTCQSEEAITNLQSSCQLSCQARTLRTHACLP